MTLPSERTRAVILTKDFLIRLSSPYGGGIKGIPSDVRQEARRLLRHYPSWYDFMPSGHFDRDEARRLGTVQVGAATDGGDQRR